MANILIVCTANICRSPVAEALLKDRLYDRGYDDWTVSSAGTWAMIERDASHNSQVVAAQYGFDISGHMARMVEESILSEADLVLCMEEGHVEALKVEFPDQANKIFPITAMAGPAYSVADPFGGSLLDYQRMAAELASIIDRGLDRIIDLAETNSTLED
jgi:protein-tyrosine-phosphatase